MYLYIVLDLCEPAKWRLEIIVPTERPITKIGIEARIAPEPLPHYLACGSALGGSSLRSKLKPDL